MTDIHALVQQFGQQHPFYMLAAGALIGPLWPKAIDWLLTNGIDKAVPKVMAFQAFYLRKFGATDAEIKAVQLREAQGLERAAEDVKKESEDGGSAPKT